jgi:hypothetical protein
VKTEVARVLGHAERKARVRDDPRRVVREAVPLERGADLVVPLRARHALVRVLRVEQEGENRDLGAEPAPQRLGRLQAEAAEGSDVVGPDEDFGHWCS